MDLEDKAWKERVKSLIAGRVQDNTQGFLGLFKASEEHDVLKELQMKFKMPLEEILSRRKKRQEE